MSHYMTALAMRQRGLKPAAKIVLYWLADHHNSETGDCFPSLKTLAKECEMDVATVKRHLAAMEGAGLIKRTRRHRENGSQTSTRYTLLLDAPLAQNAPAPSAKCANPLAQKHTPPNLGIYNLGNEPPPIVPQGGRDDFDAFWSVVPRKIAKGAARKAWAKAIKACPPSQLIDGMKRYAEQRQGQDQQYTVHPATWLNQERWQDESPTSPQDFHKQMDQHLQEALNGLSGTNGPSGISDQRVSEPLPAPPASGRTGGSAGDPRHSGGGEQRYLNLVKPRRFS